MLKSSQCEKPPALSVDKSDDICKDPCEEFHRLRRETTIARGGGGDVCGGDGEDDDKKKAEEKLKQLKLRCILGALAALVAGGIVCVPHI